MRSRLGGAAVALAAAALIAVVGCAGGSSASDEAAAVRPAAPDFTTDVIQASGGKLEATRFTLSKRADAVSVLYFSFVG